VVFGFFKKKSAKAVASDDPIAAFDGVLESMERQGQELRKSAATLLTLKTQFMRDEQRYQTQLQELEGRISEAGELGDARAETVLRRDHRATQLRLEETLKARARADEDASLLTFAVQEHMSRLEALKTEKVSAQARLSAGLVVSESLKAQVEEVDRVLKLDRARDEIERAHALADVYREDAAKKQR
jgi:phage shock protein A